jgi:Fe-S cluster assembly protein SufD
MNNTVSIIDFKESLLAQHSAFLSRIKNNSSLVVQQRRNEALSHFAKKGFPTVADEEWKYTSLSAILKKDLSFQLEPPSIKEEEINHFFPAALKANRMVFINGILSSEFSVIEDTPDVLQIKNLSEMEDLFLEQYFAQKNVSADALSCLNTAFADQGAVIHIPKGKEVKYPVMLYFISDSRYRGILSQPRNIVVMEENARLQLVESFHTIGIGAGLFNGFTEIYLKQNASLEHYKVQNSLKNSYHISTTQVVHEAKSNFNSTTITLDGVLVRNNLNIHLNAEHCESHLNGLYLPSGTMHVDNHTLVDHAKPNCYSNELYKGVLKDKATGVFNGKILVRQDAQKTNAFQSNKNILLSPEATMNTKPQLEIFADDVKCSHGATIGQLNEEPLFYLRSRGLSDQSAKALLTMAFINDIIEYVKIEPLKEAIRRSISGGMEEGTYENNY